MNPDKNPEIGYNEKDQGFNLNKGPFSLQYISISIMIVINQNSV